jgi:sporulation protein YlmC with PRC-barrel domain
MRLSDVLGRLVVTESGWPLGKARDLRVETTDRTAKVTALLITPPGARGSLLRWRSTRGHTTEHGLVPWDAVKSVEEDRIVVAEGTSVSGPRGVGTSGS